MSCHSPESVDPPAIPAMSAMTAPLQSAILRPRRSRFAADHGASEHGRAEDHRDDREADEEQDDVGDQRRPEHVGVADALE